MQCCIVAGVPCCTYQKMRNTYFKVWTNDNHPKHLFRSFIKTNLNYIPDSPVKAGPVWNPSYVYSTAANYEGRHHVIYLLLQTAISKK